MIPLYILGLLLRYGPQHGYQIKKMIEDNLADFTQIKLPTIYYHLDKMEASGLIKAASAKEGARPEKKIYTICESGTIHFKKLLNEALQFHYRPVFDSDAVFYFADYLPHQEIVLNLNAYIQRLKKSLDAIEVHYKKTMAFLPDDIKTYTTAIFDHHLLHYKAELKWAQQTQKNMKED